MLKTARQMVVASLALGAFALPATAAARPSMRATAAEARNATSTLIVLSNLNWHAGRCWRSRPYVLAGCYVGRGPKVYSAVIHAGHFVTVWWAGENGPSGLDVFRTSVPARAIYALGHYSPSQS